MGGQLSGIAKGCRGSNSPGNKLGNGQQSGLCNETNHMGISVLCLHAAQMFSLQEIFNKRNKKYLPSTMCSSVLLLIIWEQNQTEYECEVVKF